MLSDVLVLLFTPTLYILLACCSLLQFSLIFNGLSNLAYHLERTPALEAVAPLSKAIVRYLEAVFGPAYKFSPNPTHVLLVAVLLAVVAQGQRNRRL